MICIVCGAANTDDSRPCVQCGSSVRKSCPACDGGVQPGAKFCSACGCSLAAACRKMAQPSTADKLNYHSGERKQVTILFADFSGFTAFSSGLDPEDLRDTMNSIWSKLDAIIISHGGNPEKHSGDAVMAVFGGKRSREEDPAEAIRAGLEIQAWLGIRNQEKEGNSLRLRIGIHTGLVVVGAAEQTGEFLATGDTVNLAARLEQSAPLGGILISRETYHNIYGLFDAQALPPLKVKGKPEPLETYVILRAKPRGLALQFRGFEGAEIELIGRGKELEQIQSSLRKVIENRSPNAFTIIGEGGMGKTRLLREFQKWTDLLPEYFRVFCGRAGTETQSFPFGLIRDLFSVRFEIQESDEPLEAAQKFERGLIDLHAADGNSPHNPGDKLLHDIHLTGRLLGFAFFSNTNAGDKISDSEEVRANAFQAFGRILTGIASTSATSSRPKASAILLVLEDLHWSDSASLDLIEELFRNCDGLPLMVLCSARPEFLDQRKKWFDCLPGTDRINLQPLTPTESWELIGTILKRAREIPPALKELIIEGTEGNPFYIEEMIKMFMEQKVIVPGEDEYQIDLSKLISARVPSTLKGVLQARLDGLPTAERVVLQRASVVGRNFWDGTVEYLGSTDDQRTAASQIYEKNVDRNEINSALDSLRKRGLVYRKETCAFAGCSEYVFKHELLRNVAYESLLKRSRRRHHLRVADWLLSHGSTRIQEIAGLVAAHFEGACSWGESAKWHAKAAHQARLGYAPDIASAHFGKALEQLPLVPSPANEQWKLQLEWSEGLGETLAAQARFAEALAAYERMREIARSIGEPLAEARACNGLAFLQERIGDNRKSVTFAEEAEKLAGMNGEAGLAERIRAINLKGWAHYRLGNAPQVLALANETLELCGDKGDPKGIAISYKLLGVANLQLGNYPDADRFFSLGLEIFERLGDRRNTAAMWSNRGEGARACGDYTAAASLYEKALKIAREIGHRESELIYLANLAAARLRLAQFKEAESDLRQVINQTHAPNSCALAEVYSFLGEALHGQEKNQEAESMVLKAIVLAKESESSLYLAGAWRTLGKIRAHEPMSPRYQTAQNKPVDPNTADAASCFAESLSIYITIRAEGEQAHTLREWAKYDLYQGRKTEGRDRLSEARDIFEKLGAEFEVAVTEKIGPE